MTPSKKSLRSLSAAFSLVEVALALGISAFSILSLVGLLATGLALNRDSVADPEAAGIARDVASDLLRLDNWSATSPRYQIAGGSATPQTFYIGETGHTSSAPSLASLYRVDVTLGAAAGERPPSARIVVSWPAAAADPSSFYEIVTALNPQ